MINFRTTISKANKRLPLKLAAALLAGSSLLASLLGLFRDRLLNGLYYDTYPTGIDAYTVAFTIPDFMFFILVSGALSVTFIPVFNQRLATGNKKSAWELATSLLNLLALATLVTSVLIIIFAEPLVQYVVGPGLDESSRSLAVSMMRVIAINPFLFAVATVFASMQQAVGRFAFFALAPVLYNIGIIIGALFFTNGIYIFGYQLFEGGIMGVALGVVLGSILQLLVSSLGLFGMGRIAQAMAQKAHFGFRMKIIFYDPYFNDEETIKKFNAVRCEDIDELFSNSDFVSLHCPSTKETKGIVNYETISKMKKTSYLINTARGDIVVEDDLVKALNEELIMGAGLDVYEAEPKVNEGLLKLKNVFLLPHLGSATTETREAMGMRVYENIKAFFQDEEPRDRVV